jgi:drug/metabolite transporter (DMT)-like permease
VLQLAAMPRTFLWSLYALLVVIWSSTWVAIKIGLEDLPPLFSAGVRFSLAGVGLLLFAAATSRPLKSDAKLVTVLALAPFATAYGLIYITLLLPFGALAFGALAFGALVYDETITLPAVAGAALVATGLLVAQSRLAVPPRRAVARRTP